MLAKTHCVQEDRNAAYAVLIYWSFTASFKLIVYCTIHMHSPSAVLQVSSHLLTKVATQERPHLLPSPRQRLLHQPLHRASTLCLPCRRSVRRGTGTFPSIKWLPPRMAIPSCLRCASENTHYKPLGEGHPVVDLELTEDGFHFHGVCHLGDWGFVPCGEVVHLIYVGKTFVQVSIVERFSPHPVLEVLGIIEALSFIERSSLCWEPPVWFGVFCQFCYCKQCTYVQVILPTGSYVPLAGCCTKKEARANAAAAALHGLGLTAKTIEYSYSAL